MAESWPAGVAPRESECWLHHQTRTFESPLNRVRQVVAGQGVRWRLTLELFVPRDKARRVDALIARLRGGAGTVRLWDFDRPQPAIPAVPQAFSDDTLFDDGTGWTHSPEMHGAAAKGSTEIATSGWFDGAPSLQEGDRIGIDGRLYMLTHDSPANEFGFATLKIAPALRADVADGTALVTIRPTTEFRLEADEMARNPSDVSHMYRYSLEFAEVLP